MDNTLKEIAVSAEEGLFYLSGIKLLLRSGMAVIGKPLCLLGVVSATSRMSGLGKRISKLDRLLGVATFEPYQNTNQ